MTRAPRPFRAPGRAPRPHLAPSSRIARAPSGLRAGIGFGFGLVSASLLAGCAPSTEQIYDQTLANYRSAGLMRAETDPPDAPFGNAQLVRDFERIAFHMEFEEADKVVRKATPVSLVKWTGPIRWRLTGDAVTEHDRAAYRELFDRFHGLTGLEFEEVDDSADIFILIANKDLRDAFVAELRRVGAGSRMLLVQEWAVNDIYPCVGQVGRSREEGGWKNKATVVIKGETKGLLRESCIHEEISQVLGLLNDDGQARPSIFNDDQEFALLTVHDEYLLRILYDPRLKAGMSAEEGMPIVREIVAEIGPGDLPGTPTSAGENAGAGAGSGAGGSILSRLPPLAAGAP